jgi:hypothetical protein
VVTPWELGRCPKLEPIEGHRFHVINGS